MNAKTITALIMFALLAGCTTGKPPSSNSPRGDEAADRKPPARRAHDTSWASPGGMGKAREAEIRREVAAAIERRREAYERHDVDALEKLLADEFKVSYAGLTQTKSNALSGLRASEAEGMVIEDVKIRVDEHFPVVTLRSISRFKPGAGAETITFETLSSLQFRVCSVAEERRGCEKWLVTAATHMQVHQMPSDYWTRENSWRPKP